MATETVTLTYVRGGVTYTKTVTVSDPVTGGFPDASNTGATGNTFTNGPATTSASGQTFTNLIFTGDSWITGNNNRFVNCKWTGTSFWPLRITGTGNVIEHSTFLNGSNSQCSVEMGSGNTVQFCDISGAGDGIRGQDNCLVTDNFVHPTGPADAHRDAIDIEGTIGNNIIRHNRVEVYSNQTSCLTLENDVGSGKWDNNLVENNFFAGAGYIFYFVSRVPITNLIVRNNTFSKKFFPTYGGQPDSSGQALVYQKFGNVASNIWSGNVDADSGATVAKP